MSGSRTTEKLILLVLAAMVGAFLGGEALLNLGGDEGNRIVLAENRTTSGPANGNFASLSGGVEPVQTAPLLEKVAPPIDRSIPEFEVDYPTTTDESLTELEPGPAPWSGAVRLQGEVRSRDITISSQITWRPLDSQGDEEVRVVETDSQGTYAVTLTRPGLHLVEVHPSAFFDEVSTNGIELLVDIPSQAVARWNLTLPGGTLEGQLETQAGQPVVDAFLELVSVQDGFGCRSTNPSPRRSMSDEEGRFRFEFLAPGDYAVSTSWDPSDGELNEDEANPGARMLARSRLVSIPENGRAKVDLRLPAPIPSAIEEPGMSSRIRVLEEGEPYLGASVWLRRVDQPTLRGQLIGTTGRDGYLVLPDLGENPGTLLVAKGVQSVSAPRFLAANETSIDLMLQAAGRLRVITRNPDGEGVAASVEVLSVDDREMVWARDNGLLHPRSRSVRTEAEDDLAQHELGPFLPGNYLVRAWTSAGLGASAKISIEAGDAPTTLELELRVDQ